MILKSQILTSKAGGGTSVECCTSKY